MTHIHSFTFNSFGMLLKLSWGHTPSYQQGALRPETTTQHWMNNTGQIHVGGVSLVLGHRGARYPHKDNKDTYLEWNSKAK